MQAEFEKHHKNKELSRNAKADDKKRSLADKKFACACYDLQKVLPVPKAEVSQLYYKRKLAVYNFTVYDMGNKQGYCYMWHEAIAHRGSTEIATCVAKFLTREAHNGVKEVTFYSDNCAGQNKNQFIVAMYAKAVLTSNIEIITHKFLGKGHTQNEGDSMHSVIEKAIGRTPS